MRKIVLILTILAFISIGATFLVRARTEKTVQATTVVSPTVAVDVVTPSRGDLSRKVEVFGSLSPKSTNELKSELLGSIAKTRVKEWDKVKPGQVLAEMDPVDFRLNLNKNEANLKMARAQLLQARVEQDRAKREWKRAQKLKEGGLITGQDLDEKQTSLDGAEARIALAQAQISQAEAQVAEARHSLEKTNICAPIEGVVSHRAVDVGDFVDKGTALFTIVDNRILDFTATVPATDLALVTEGQMLSFTVDGIPNRTFQGQVKRVNPMVNSSDRSGRIQAEVLNSDGALRGGLYARGHVLVEEHKNALIIPKAALMGQDMEKATARVFLVDEGGIARVQPVTTGLTGEDTVEIRSGLSGSEKIVIRGGFNIKEGDRVQVLEKTGDKEQGAPSEAGGSDKTHRSTEVGG